MQRHGIKARGKRKLVVTTDSKHNLPIAENLLERNFSPEAPNQVWTSDITYIATDEGWLYLTGVIELFSRQVVDWSMRDNMQTNAVTDGGWTINIQQFEIRVALARAKAASK